MLLYYMSRLSFRLHYSNISHIKLIIIFQGRVAMESILEKINKVNDDLTTGAKEMVSRVEDLVTVNAEENTATPTKPITTSTRSWFSWFR